MQEPADYLEGTVERAAFEPAAPRHSIDDFGVPYHDLGVELGSPSRGVVVWALLKEVGIEGLRRRVVRHTDGLRTLQKRRARIQTSDCCSTTGLHR